jgi:hypothetical protein
MLLKRILPLIVATIDDLAACPVDSGSQVADAIQAYDPLPNAMDSLVPAYETLQDPEAEVRTAATFNFVAKCKAMVGSPQVVAPRRRRRSRSGSACRWRTAVVTSLTEDDE